MLTISAYKKAAPAVKVLRNSKMWNDIECIEAEFIHGKTLFRCPEFVPAGVEDNDFCVPKDCCPETLPQPKFSSPFSSFSPGVLEELEDCIRRANELLLALAVSEDEKGVDAEGDLEAGEPNARALQQSLRSLRDQFVTVHYVCSGKKQEVCGYFLDAGIDFIIIEKADTCNIAFIPTRKILSIHDLDRGENITEEQELICINPCLRRDLTFHFGELVTKSPYLLNLFFGIKLKMLLESYIGYYCYIQTETDNHEIDGTLEKIDDRDMLIQKYDEKHWIDFEDICLIELEK
ncbi:hypothetical protein [Cytobacillus gottheilii]|uniref:hypothetical protein n=1 Tax=Cytobacillus gottheilii TaxID=859144 RepID=UPI0012E70A1D|nr:hypothetical protein [Cytobacillus gottheilii]